MDPTECYSEFLDAAFINDAPDTASEKAKNLIEWLLGGGYMPEQTCLSFNRLIEFLREWV